MFSPLIDELIKSLRVLPGVGPKSAQRMALHLLEHDRAGASALSKVLDAAVEKVAKCQKCRNLTENPLCHICENPRRQSNLMCVVESPADVLALESSATYSGHYFVLHGRLSPIDGMGPGEIGMNELEQTLAQGEVEEIIIATNPSVEGEATALFIAEKAKKHGVRVSKIAQGVPLGGELEYLDVGTLAHALNTRSDF
jgi:recombination protein RecR